MSLGGDGSEYNYNVAFADGFDISADDSRMILGTKIFKLADGDADRGDAIAVDGTDFYHVGEYISGTQPFSTYVDGDMFLMFRREFNADLGYDEINVYFVPLGTGSPVKVISDPSMSMVPDFGPVTVYISLVNEPFINVMVSPPAPLLSPL